MAKSKKVNQYVGSGYLRFSVFVLATIILGIVWINSYNTWLADINKTEHDPLWQLFYPYMCMPVISLIYGISEGGKKYRYLIPLIASIAGFLLYISASDGGEHIGEAIPLSDFIPTGIPSLIAALIGIGIARIVLSITKASNSKK